MNMCKDPVDRTKLRPVQQRSRGHTKIIVCPTRAFALTLERQRHRGSRSERNGICDQRQSLSFAPTM